MSLTDYGEITYHLAFPVPYRTFFLIGLGILAWATNLHGLDAAGVDAVAAMDLRTDTNPSKLMMPVHHSASFNHSKAIALYNSVYCLLFLYSTFCFLSWFFFRMVTHGDATLVDYYGYIPLITAITIFLILICPYNILLKTEREKFTL
jgi:cytochrome c oxidase subunit IV